ncbi:MAG: CsgG/HfaB family protein [bacterium]
MRPFYDMSSGLTLAALDLVLLFSFFSLVQANNHPFYSTSDSAAITVAVLDFQNNSGAFSLDALERSVPEMLKTELSQNSAGILVVERRKLELILQEQALAQSGVIDEKTAQTVGRLAGAQYLLSGEISSSGDSRLRIDCHILKVETGRVRGEKVIGQDRQVLDDMVHLLASNVLYNLTGEGGHQQNLRVKNYPTSWFLLATAVTATAAGVTHVISHDAYQQYQSTTDLEEFDKYYNRATNFRTARNVLAVASGALAVASVHLWLKARSEKNQVFAAREPDRQWRLQEVAFCAGADGIQIGVRMHF